jgi:hypothetical protein
MERKRISVIVALAVVSTVSPLTYQYLIQPRVEAAGVRIELTGIQYNDVESSSEATAFTLYLKLLNDVDNDVILSPLQLDVYFHDYEEGRFRLIGEFFTEEDYKIPKRVQMGEPGYVGSRIDVETGQIERFDPYDKSVGSQQPYNLDRNIQGVLKVYKTSGFTQGSNKALMQLLNKQSVTLYLKGSANFGPISIPFTARDVLLETVIWDPEIIIHDVFLLYEGSPVPTTHPDTFVLHTKMRNPSGLPLTLVDFNLGLYNRTDDPENPVTEADKVGWPIDSVRIVESRDPDESNRWLTDIYLEGSPDYQFGTERWLWQDVFFAFNLTNPSNPGDNSNKEWFVKALLQQNIIQDITLKGYSHIYLGPKGDISDKGFKINLTEDTGNLTLTNVKFYQKYINKYGDKAKFTGQQPITMYGNFTVGQLSVNKLTIDTNPANPEMTLDIDANMKLRNPYRFEYQVADFQTQYDSASLGYTPFAYSKTNTTTTITRASRYQYPNGTFTNTIIETEADIPINLTTTYQTNDTTAGIYKIFDDLGADTRLLNLTNPFWLPPGTPEYDKNPLTTMEFLVDSGVNSLTLLNETDYLVKVQDYQPLRAMYFGNTPRPEDQVAVQATSNTDLPYLDSPLTGADSSNYLWDNGRYHNTYPENVLTTWNQLYDGGAIEALLKGPNMYQWVERGAGSPTTRFDTNYFRNDEDLLNPGSSDYLLGAIFDGSGGSRTGDFDNRNDSPHSDLIWRFYQTGTNNDVFGPNYDHFNYGDKGYFVSMSVDSAERAMAVQNFTIDPLKFKNGRSDIEQVTISLSYRYIDKGFTLPAGYLLFDWMNPNTGQFTHQNPILFPPLGGTAYNSRRGYSLPIPADRTWTQYSVDITDDFKDRLDDMINFPGNPNYTQGEIGFAASGLGQRCRIQFDDVVLNIKYKDYNQVTGIDLQNLFSYLEENDPVQGNMFNLFNQLSDNAFIDSLDFWEFIANDGGPTQPTQGGADLFRMMQYENVSLSTITEILDDQYQALGVGEPANFLEMLTKSKYRVKEPGENWNPADPFDSPYGPRKYNDPDWTIEDPYHASRIIADALKKGIFVDDGGAETDPSFTGEELWFMLENLGVTMPWVIMYLLTHGWSSSDVWDALEALGFAHETQTPIPFDASRDHGQLYTQVHLRVRAVLGLVTMDEDMEFTFNMDPVLSSGIQELFSNLCAANVPAQGGTERILIYNSGDFGGGEEEYYQGHGSLLGIGFSVDIWVTPNAFSMKIWMEPDPNKLISIPDDTSDLLSTAYLMLGSGAQRGLNNPGTRALANAMRINYKFRDSTFITTSGDPISLFQFLDDYYFGGLDTVDYSSFQLLHKFDVDGADFIDLITGYNRIKGEHDWNGNGLADDWIAPDTYGGGNPGNRGNLNGWETNFRDSRLFWESGYNSEVLTGQMNGKIIWSDSPDFTTAWDNGLGGSAHRSHSNGDIDRGTIPVNGDRINESAPEIVDLLDMLSWISDSSGSPKPDDLFRWLLGELGSTQYDIIDPRWGFRLDPSFKQDGINNQKSWQMLRDASFNATGFFHWLENEKNINSFRFMYLLNQSTTTINPTDLLFFATSPNLVRYVSDAIAFYYHDALDSDNTVEANDILWTFFTSASFNVKGFWQTLNASGINIFKLMLDLRVDPASWLNILNDRGHEPMEIIMRMLKLNPGLRYLDLTSGAYSEFNVEANLTLSYSGIVLDRFYRLPIAYNKKLYADIHFDNFIDTSRLTGENFKIWNSA